MVVIRKGTGGGKGIEVILETPYIMKRIVYRSLRNTIYKELLFTVGPDEKEIS